MGSLPESVTKWGSPLQIDKLLGTHPQEIISPGQGVKAMILNGLGLISAPLYLFEKFFVGKATEHLLGKGIRPEHLNDDRLGRILDKLAGSGLTETFVTVALSAARQFEVKLDSLHLDSSSFHVDGEYLQTQEPIVEPGEIHITHGYSRDHRPDLKQFIVDLMCSGDGDIPLYLRVGDGNETDSAMFGKLVTQFKQQWNIDALFVADAALYTAGNLTQMSQLRWVSISQRSAVFYFKYFSQYSPTSCGDGHGDGFMFTRLQSRSTFTPPSFR